MDLEGVGFVLTLLGMGVTIWQVVTARRAAVAARDAAQATTQRFGSLILYALLPQMRGAENDLRYAREANDHALALRACSRWRDPIGEVRGFLKSRGELSNRLEVALTRCSVLLHDAEQVLSSRATPVGDAVAEVLREMGDLSVLLGELSAQILTEVHHAGT